MNLAKLFETQRLLDERILEQHPELKVQENLDWKVLALQVELGECANEYRGFKKWSNDQEPRTKLFTWIDGLGRVIKSLLDPRGVNNNVPNGFNAFRVKNPLLEEYVDCLHFILSIGLELNIQDRYANEVNFNIGSRTKRTFPTDEFRNTFRKVAVFDMCWNEQDYMDVFTAFSTLGDALGFTEEEIEEAYFKKNEINLERQATGY
ncbi:dUTP diphosphatase [Psychrobacillus sp. FSL K6-2365]|uniref:dUTP diphosphatase n=1 Tax=Psychrobacillus sp. FSL K6-2365 TaxID=2921546 RepID=UPI0030FCB678